MRLRDGKDASYTDAVAYLTEHPDKISAAWSNPAAEPGGCLFAFATHDGRASCGGGVGCLTSIRCTRNSTGYKVADCGIEITREIQDDERLPERAQGITVGHLPIFAEWQKRLDREFDPETTHEG